MKNKALFIDRDGVINIDRVHVSAKENFEFTRGIFDICRKYSEAGYLIIIITNQAGIAKGLYDENTFTVLMDWVIEEFRKRGVVISRVTTVRIILILQGPVIAVNPDRECCSGLSRSSRST